MKRLTAQRPILYGGRMRKVKDIVEFCPYASIDPYGEAAVGTDF